MKKIFYTIAALALSLAEADARSYYLSPAGNDNAAGTVNAPFATMRQAQSVVQAGDTVFIREGRYMVSESEIMSERGPYACVYNLDKSGTADKRICYFGYPGERPVFDFSNVKPEGKRVCAFNIKGSWLYLKNFEIVGVQVTVTGHTQSECISACGGSHCTFENLAMHDGMAIGYYQTAGSHNLVLNCDAYNNYDNFSEGPKGGNTDGFGGHVKHDVDTCNVFRGCRAWWNSDDGFDLINNYAAFVIEDCWAMYNGYQPGGTKGAGDGTGIKAGGYGMGKTPKVPNAIPVNVVRRCVAYNNKNRNFYANHHLGGLVFENNSSMMGGHDFNMVNRKSAEEAIDVEGYGHILRNNVSFNTRREDLSMCDKDLSTLENNSFGPTKLDFAADDFLSVDPTELMAPRKPDGSLPDVKFLKAKATSILAKTRMGWAWEIASTDTTANAKKKKRGK